MEHFILQILFCKELNLKRNLETTETTSETVRKQHLNRERCPELTYPMTEVCDILD